MQFLSKINPDFQKTLILDVTYHCNGTCRYCQWSKYRNQNRYRLTKSDLFIPYETLKALRIERLVFSGGEPILYPGILKLFSYYARCNFSSIIIMTNGIGLTKTKLKQLWNAGVSGFTFSLDSIDPKIAYQTRGLLSQNLNLIKANLVIAGEFKRTNPLELGINITLSHVNLSEDHLLFFLHYLNQFSFDWIKFQPLFDDGFVSKNSPELLLTQKISQNY